MEGGGVPERSNGARLKRARRRKASRGFESLPLRHRFFHMRTILGYILFGIILTEPAFSLDESTVGKFDYFVMALSWEPAFCATKPNRPECLSLNMERFAAKNLALHGLQPRQVRDSGHAYGYCSIGNGLRDLDEKNEWCKLPRLDLSEDTERNLKISMPGFASCLERHEWYKHGSCSGLEAEAYFAVSNAFVANFAKTRLGKYISANVGRTVELADLLARLREDFGADSARSFAIKCRTTEDADTLWEVRVNLKNPLPESA